MTKWLVVLRLIMCLALAVMGVVAGLSDEYARGAYLLALSLWCEPRGWRCNRDERGPHD